MLGHIHHCPECGWRWHCTDPKCQLPDEVDPARCHARLKRLAKESIARSGV